MCFACAFAVAAGTPADGNGQDAQDGGETGHQDGPEPGPRGLDRALGDALPGGATGPRELHDQDRVLCRQSQQHHKSNLSQNVDRHADSQIGAHRRINR